MNPQDALTVVSEIRTNGDYVLEAAKWVVFLVLLLGVGAVPLMMLLNKRHKDGNENRIESAITDAGSSLYTQLASQLEEYRKTAQEAHAGRDELLIRITRLEIISEQYETAKVTLEKLKLKLDAKDAEIKGLLTQAAEERALFLSVLMAKDKDIVVRDERITQLEKSVHEMELRLVLDETRQLFSSNGGGCPLAAPKSSDPVPVEENHK